MRSESFRVCSVGFEGARQNRGYSAGSRSALSADRRDGASIVASAAKARFICSTSRSDISSRFIKELRATSFTRISSSSFSCIASRVAVLRVLDQEHHQERDDRRAGVDDELPGVATSRRSAQKRPIGRRPRSRAQRWTSARLGVRPTGQTARKPGFSAFRAHIREGHRSVPNFDMCRSTRSWSFGFHLGGRAHYFQRRKGSERHLAR